jgi:hypothetical protein
VESDGGTHMSFTVQVTGVTLNPLTVEVLLTHSSGATRTFVATRTEAVPYVHTGTRPITDEELAAFQAASTQAQRRAAIKVIVQARLPEERPRVLAVVDAPANTGSAPAADLPPAFNVTDT